MSSNKLTSPYTDTELYSRILLQAKDINNDIYITLKNNLKRKVEKKCSKYGYITKVYRLLNYNDGEIPAENFDASVIFNIKYSCRLCYPTSESNIICNVDLLNKSLIKASNGPIICIISLNRINTDVFNIDNKGDIIHIDTNHLVTSNDKIIVNIKGINFFPNDERIVVLGHLNNIATDKEINDYYNNENFNIENIVDEVNDLNINDSQSDNDNQTDDYNNNNYLNL